MTFMLNVAGMLLMSAVAGFVLPMIAVLVGQREKAKIVAGMLFALALVGASAGLAGGMSRDAAVGDIVPAFLGLLGGVAVYLFGVDQSKGLIASFGAATLSISLMLGFSLGASYRNTPDDHRNIRTVCANAFTNAELLASDVAFERFRQQMGALCDASMFWHITVGPPE